MTAPVNVLASALCVTLTDYSTGIGTTIAEAVMDLPAGTYWIITDEARDAIAELIEADKEYSGAYRALVLATPGASIHDLGNAMERRSRALANVGVQP